MNKYEKFKSLLEYFTAHLEWLINRNMNGRGYQKYIAPIINTNNFYETGQGYKNGNIQNQIIEWSEFDDGSVYINVQPNYGKYDTVKCYLNWAETGLNINAVWSNNVIESFELQEYKWWEKPPKRVKLNILKSINELGLFDNNTPNDNLKSFFNEFYSILIEWNENEQKQYEMKNIQPYIDLIEQNKNVILTGAPGTGKTYLAKQIAKYIIGVESDEELENSGQFSFVQFHPSYDYTDFVEGLRPTMPDKNGVIGFELRNGIFKEFCRKAIGVKAISSGEILTFTIENYEIYLQSIGLHEKTIRNYRHRIDQLLGKDLKPKKEVLERFIYNDLNDICDNVLDVRDFDLLNNFHGQFAAAAANLNDFRDNLSSEQHKTIDKKPNFVFVIDEINRGEISKIFGELFFSIDPGYRGKKGAVKTQYSNLHEDDKEVFYVPENVYIIGAMNDIDRSVESFDFAMRRRFTWIEITSESSAENMNLPDITKVKMSQLNSQISQTEGLDSSYHLGGAYFLDTNGNPVTDLDFVWQYRIEPLLKEYLRGIPNSFEKIEVLRSVYNS
jgi:5-methylcytosine-specific restriction protein B